MQTICNKNPGSSRNRGFQQYIVYISLLIDNAIGQQGRHFQLLESLQNVDNVNTVKRFSR